MTKSAHQAAIDQAYLLAAYLDNTPSSALDLNFIHQHLDTLGEFARAAKWESAYLRPDLTRAADSNDSPPLTDNSPA